MLFDFKENNLKSLYMVLSKNTIVSVTLLVPVQLLSQHLQADTYVLSLYGVRPDALPLHAPQ